MKKTTTIILSLLSILLVSLCTIAATYSVIIEVTENDGLTEMVNKIKIKDLLTNDDGSYNQTYYDVKSELALTKDEADILIESIPINEALQIVLKSIVDYKANNIIDAKLSYDELYDIIADAVIDTDNITDELKSRIINKASIYRKDISKYIYDIEVSILGDRL